MVNPPGVRLGGVGAEEGLGAGSLILTPDAFLLVIFLAFLEAGGVSVTLHLPSRVLEDPTLGPFDDALTDLALGARAETGTTKMGVSPSMLGICTIKLSKACDQIYEHGYLKKIDG
jgi:hypothetical protein